MLAIKDLGRSTGVVAVKRATDEGVCVGQNAHKITDDDKPEGYATPPVRTSSSKQGTRNIPQNQRFTIDVTVNNN